MKLIKKRTSCTVAAPTKQTASGLGTAVNRRTFLKGSGLAAAGAAPAAKADAKAQSTYKEIEAAVKAGKLTKEEAVEKLAALKKQAQGSSAKKPNDKQAALLKERCISLRPIFQ